MRLSPSQIKTYVSSRAKRAGSYIFGIKDEREDNEATVIGRLYEHLILDGKEDFEIVSDAVAKDKSLNPENIIEGYDVLKKHYTVGEMKISDTQVKVEGNNAE